MYKVMFEIRMDGSGKVWSSQVIEYPDKAEADQLVHDLYLRSNLHLTPLYRNISVVEVADSKPEPAGMTLDQFQQAALRTWNQDQSGERRIFNAAFGLAGETGEVLDMLKKRHFHGKRVYFQDLLLEFGDVLYYLAVLCHEHGFTLEDAALAVTEKLQKRHPNGFDPSYHKRPPETEADWYGERMDQKFEPDVVDEETEQALASINAAIARGIPAEDED